MMRTAIELFSGRAAGWTLGLHWAGVSTVGACEIDQGSADAYHACWGIRPHGDIQTYRPDVTPWLLCGSPPCQDASEINRKGQGIDGDRTSLFFEAIRIAAERRPPWVALENVSGLRTRGADRVLAGLERIGYAPRSLVVNSRAAGRDHDRARVIIVAADSARRERWSPGLPWTAPSSAPSGRQHVPGLEDRRSGLPYLRPETLGRAVRAYDGIPDQVAEADRRAYGNSLDPIFPYLIARALIAWEERP